MAERARLESVYRETYRGFESLALHQFILNDIYYGDSIRPLATLSWELRQVRKEATVPSDACAEVRRVGLPPSNLSLKFNCKFSRIL